MKITSVLLVDDMEIEHINVKYILEDFDESIILHSAYDGLEALELLEKMETKPDLILLDINMPRMNGHEFLAHYSKKNEQVSIVVMLTSSEQKSDKDACKKYDFVKSFISKPLEIEHISELASMDV